MSVSVSMYILVMAGQGLQLSDGMGVWGCGRSQTGLSGQGTGRGAWNEAGGSGREARGVVGEGEGGG